MIELNFFDLNGNAILTLNNIVDINAYFGNALDVSTPQALIMDLMTNHNRHTLGDDTYYFHTTNINNTSETIKLGYTKLS